MNRKQLLQKRLKGGITTYVLIMFGVSIMLYMFGFHAMMGTGITGDTGYRSTSSLNGDTNSSVTNPNMQMDANPLQIALSSVLKFTKDNPLFVVGGIAGLCLLGVASLIFGANLSVLYTYIIPIALIAIFLNYFIFPINPGSTELSHMQLAPNLPVSTVLTIFFNLFYILAIIAYIRSNET